MNIKAKQLLSIDTTRMDITTALGFFGQIKNLIQPQTALLTVLGTVWTDFVTALAAFDEAYAQVRKWLQTEDIKDLDDVRDAALRGFLNALKAMQDSPNAEKRQKALYLQNVREKYTLNPSDEYMKETTAISQMIQEMDTNYQCELALQQTGLQEWYDDLKAKNEAFLAKMNERTDAQAGQQTGVVREKRLACEAAYRDLKKAIDAAAICEIGEGIDYDYAIDKLNAEIEHYKQILARKGTSGGDEPEPEPQPEPEPEPEPQPEPEN